MDCKIFRKRLTDLLEDNISYDLKDAMLEHVKNCEACKTLYDEEVFIDEAFKSSLAFDAQSFRSLRTDIMKNINKNKYGKNPVKKFLYNIKRFSKTYLYAAVFIIFAVIVTPYIIKNGFISLINKGIGMEIANKSSEGALLENYSVSGEKEQKNQIAQSKAAEDNSTNSLKSAEIKSEVKDAYMPRFEKKALEKSYKPKLNTLWKNSTSKKYSAALEGKGPEAIEEGIANIILKEVNTGKQWSFNLVDNDGKQFSPKAIEWIDDEHLLVIIGYGYKAVNQGGLLYVLNIVDAGVYEADPNNTINLNPNSEITKILSVKRLSSNDLQIDVEVLVFDDEALNTSHRENRTIMLSQAMYK
ncbi:DUF4652 domain-containing protein [Clostridium sp. SYSU_GA19001]|uniref:DUF4652 domain-containing protein n=1 Tax=Clostridium caldaquaticum TaxID=2940653 RepID=UPI002077273B|nr:DUF4652 domain-containing protein [Clostridium caldaquaticum]MCM8710748.1 DUF4652 domain-containing protein [Clostridium caldaquaticum]